MTYKQVLEALRSTNSRTEKIQILREADATALLIFEYAYNPFKHYFINKIPKAKPSSVEQIFSGRWWHDLLYSLSERKLSGDAGKESVVKLLDSATPDDAELFGQILKKDLRCGVSTKTINAAIPGLIPEFGTMLAKKWDDARLQKNLYMSIKFDGLRAIFKDGTLYTRNGHKVHGVKHITDILPDSHSFDGELTLPGTHFQDTSGSLRSFNATPDAVYNIFDIVQNKVSFDKRYALYSEICKYLNPTIIQPVKHIKVKGIDHLYTTFDKVLKAGFEGLVIKTSYHEYQYKRSWDWMKLKAERSEDLKVVDFFEGTGKYEGMLGGIIVDFKGVQVRVGSGFSDAERSNIWQDQGSFLGKTVEVKYHEVTPDGSLRHPVYKGFRWDK